MASRTRWWIRLMVIGALGVLLGAPAASASILFFRPSGTQEDADEILDILAKPGDRIEFRIFMQTSPLLGTLHGLTYTMGYDITELFLDTSGTQLDRDSRFATDDLVPDSLNGTLTFRHSGGTIGGNEGVFLDRILFGVLPGVNSDGRPDFEFRVLIPDGEPLVPEFPDEFSAAQQGVRAVEVQPTRSAIPEPSSLLLFGPGLLGLAGSRRKRT